MIKSLFYFVGVMMFLFVFILLRGRLFSKDKHMEVNDVKLAQSNMVSLADNYHVVSKKNIFKPQKVYPKSGRKGILEIDHKLPPIIIHTEEMQKGQREGAQGAITLLVVDSEGKPVPDATVRGAFWYSDTKHYSFNVNTDEKGVVSLEDKCTGDLNFSIRKDGYYNTSLRYWFLKHGFDCAKDGRWLPWNPIVEVMLKEKRNPAKMIIKDVNLNLPIKNKEYGFDFLIGDLVSPDGRGKIADVLIKCWG